MAVVKSEEEELTEDVSDDNDEEGSLRSKQKQELKELRGKYSLSFNSRDH